MRLQRFAGWLQRRREARCRRHGHWPVYWPPTEFTLPVSGGHWYCSVCRSELS